MENEPSLENDNMLWQLIDFDKVLCDSSGHPDYLMLGPMPGAVEGMKELDRRGWKLIIYTARPWADYLKIETWLKKHDIPSRRIVCGKLLGRWLLDDRAIEFKPYDAETSWERALDIMGHPAGTVDNIVDPQIDEVN